MNNQYFLWPDIMGFYNYCFNQFNYSEKLAARCDLENGLRFFFLDFVLKVLCILCFPSLDMGSSSKTGL